MADPQFWNNLYLSGQTGWDLGMVSPPMKAYIDQLEKKQAAILTPGAGNSYEALYLNQQGFTNVTVVDIAKAATEKLREKTKDAAGALRIIHGDFFQHDGKYDLILEQTFFCALEPLLREPYARHMHALLNPAGRLAGLLFNREFEPGRPPYGGNASDYRQLLEPYFNFLVWEPCYNSASARAGSEWFMVLEKK